MKLTEQQVNIFKLIKRSKPVDGWYKISSVVWPVIKAADMPRDLVTIYATGNGEYNLTLTRRGEAVMDYLI